jgi:hypothetical protein
MPIGMSKNIFVSGDTWRGRGYLWDRTESLPYDFTVPVNQNFFTLRAVANPTIGIPIPRRYTGKDVTIADMARHGGFDIPSSIVAGSYLLDPYSTATVPSEAVVPITVLSPIKRQPFTVAPNATMDQIQKYINLGFDIVLQPGLYEWPVGEIITQPFMKIRGYGATILRENNPLEIFSIADGVLIEGINFVGDEGSGLVCRYTNYFQTITPNYGAVILRCTFENISPGTVSVGAYLESCTIKGGGASTLTPACYRNVKISDTKGNAALLFGAPIDSNACIIDMEFIGTDRGPCLQCLYNDVKNILIVGLRIHDTLWIENGSECCLCEPTFDRAPYGWHDSMILHTRIWNSGSFIQLDGTGSNLLIADTYMDSCVGMVLWGGNVSNITIDQAEFRNGASLLLGPTNGVKFTNGAFVQYQGGRWNEQYSAAAWYAPTSPVKEVGPVLSKGTTFDNFDFLLLPGQTPFQYPGNYGVTNSRVNGVAYV